MTITNTRRVIVLVLFIGAIYSGLWNAVVFADNDPIRVEVHASPRPLNPVTFKVPDGSIHTLEEFSGKFIVLNVWATWCAPCRREMPSLDELNLLLSEKGVEVIAVSQDRAGAILVNQFFEKYNIKHLKPYFDSTERSQRQLRITVMPTTLFINENGFEVGRLIGSADWVSGEILNLISSLRLMAGPAPQ